MGDKEFMLDLFQLKVKSNATESCAGGSGRTTFTFRFAPASCFIAVLFFTALMAAASVLF